MPTLHSVCPLLPNNHGCPCKRLLDPWSTAKPPKYLCHEVMRASVMRWVDDRADEVVTSLTTGEVGLQPISGEVLDEANPELSPALAKLIDEAVASLTTGEAGTQPISVDVLDEANPELSPALAKLIDVTSKDEFPSHWPYPLGNRFLACVVTQWVQEVPNEMFANLIDSHPTWRSVIERLRARLVTALGEAPDFIELADQVMVEVIELLQQCRIPVTPANVGYGLAQTAGEGWRELHDHHKRLIATRDSDNRPLPARGVKLTTLIFASLSLWRSNEKDEIDDPQPAWLIQPHAELGMSGEVAHLTGPFVNDYLVPAVLAHRQFILSLSAHPFSDIASKRRAAPTSFPATLTGAETEFDYVQEARLEAGKQQKGLRALASHWSFENSVDKILDRVQKRVSQRRKRAGIPTTPPKGWRKEAEKAIREDLGP